MATSPKISVILPVYNAEKYIAESIKSILDQTFRDFEFIIINDGSKDKSEEIILSFKDERIVYISQQNIGLAATLNKGIEVAKGSYIARQDNDDISFKERLRIQYEFLEKNKGIDLVGASAEIIDEKGQPTGRFHRHETSNDCLKFFLLFDNPFVHSAVMFRKATVQKIGGYNTSKEIFEDYNLWSRIARVSGVSNVPDVLLKYREVATGMSKTATDYREKVKTQSLDNIKFYIPSVSEEELNSFNEVESVLSKYKNTKAATTFFDAVLLKLKTAFCDKERAVEQSIEPILLKLRLNFRRKVYNTIINSPSYSGWEKFKAKVSRKTMFMMNKEQLN